MSTPTQFIHLRLRTEYSLVDGLVRVKSLVKKAVELGMPAVAVTDHVNLFALVKFQKAALGAGVKPIFGADIWVRFEEGESPSLMTFLMMDAKGYKHLTEIISEAYQHGQELGLPVVSRETIEKYSEGLVALSGGKLGDVGGFLLGGHGDEAAARLQTWQEIFPDRYYLELQRTGRENDEVHLHAAIELATKNSCPVVATNDVRFLEAEQFEAHETRVCIGEGRVLEDQTRPRNYSEEQYLRSADEMVALFEDIPEALENSVEIAKRCNLTVELGKNYLPNYPIPEGQTIEEYFAELSLAGMDWRLESILEKNDPEYQQKYQIYRDRLQFELDVINQMGFPGYFLIVMDFIGWAKEHQVPVGPGRGSGAGSLVAYSLKITDLDPIEYDLLFERFLNPERVSMPDFDVDFCMDGRDRVIDYVAERYGRNAVSQIITFGSMAAKAVVRDVARVQGKSYSLADRLSKMIPFEPGITLSRAMEQEEAMREFVANDEEAGEIMEMAFKLEGITRNVGKHAGGVVIAPTMLTDFCPVYCDETGGNLVTQYDKDDVEAAGLVKFDFLGLRTLTIIDWALTTINILRRKSGEGDLDIATIPLQDEATFDLLQRAETTAVFQLESRGMKELIKRLKPNCFEDIVALVALFRPGPLQSGMVDDFINRKHGRAAVEYPHPDLEPILCNTYGVILYQEQVMQIAQVLAKYSLGQADMLRRAMGKKKPEEMEKQRTIFNEGAAGNGIDSDTATYIFDLMEKFAGYGFNKSHSAAYALVSYQTAWLKTHYAAPFMAAVLSSDMDNTDKVVVLIEECRSMDLEVHPPMVNHSEYKFTVVNDEIVYGLGAVKGVGEGAIETIVLEREKNGTYSDLFEFCRRVDMKKLNRRTLEALIRGGAMDCLDQHRSTLFASLARAIKAADQHAENQNSGMLDLFGGGEDSSAPQADYVRVPQWSDDERLGGEKDTLGLYLTGHPIDQYEADISHFISRKIVDLQAQKGEKLVIAGLVVAMRTMKTKKGSTICFLSLDDRSARIEVSLFSKTYELYKDRLVKDQLLVIEGEAAHDDFSGGLKFSADKVFDITGARGHYAKRLELELGDERLDTAGIQRLQSYLTAATGGETPVMIEYVGPQALARIRLGDGWKVHPSTELIAQLQTFYGTDQVRMKY